MTDARNIVLGAPEAGVTDRQQDIVKLPLALPPMSCRCNCPVVMLLSIC